MSLVLLKFEIRKTLLFHFLIPLTHSSKYLLLPYLIQLFQASLLQIFSFIGVYPLWQPDLYFACFFCRRITYGQLLWCKANDKAALQQVVLFNGKGEIWNGIWVEEAVQMIYFFTGGSL